MAGCLLDGRTAGLCPAIIVGDDRDTEPTEIDPDDIAQSLRQPLWINGNIQIARRTGHLERRRHAAGGTGIKSCAHDHVEVGRRYVITTGCGNAERCRIDKGIGNCGNTL